MSNLPKKFWFETLGCKANQYDSQRLRTALTAHGWLPAEDQAQADLVVVNTCAVTAEAGRKSRQLLRRAQRGGAGTEVIATGCLVAFNQLTGETVDPLIKAFAAGAREEGMAQLLDWLGHQQASPPPIIDGFQGRIRSFIKAQDGCNNHCTYCIIPQLRGPACSRPLTAILQEATGLIAAGVPELVLTGVCLGNWQDEGKGPAWLVARLADLPGDFRLRLSSIEPEHCGRELFTAMAVARVCPHLHLPLQSGSDEILRRMGRRYRSGDFRTLAVTAGEVLPDPALTTDVIVGFPGETEQHFQETVSLLKELQPSRIHVFPFSPREHTPAAKLPQDVPAAEKKKRAAVIRELGNELAVAAARARVGAVEKVIVEHGNKGWSGRYQQVRIAGPALQPGQMVTVEITGFAGEELVGRVLS